MKKLNSKGFSIVEGLVIIVIVGLIAGVGWLVLQRQKNKDNSSNTSQSSAAELSSETSSSNNSNNIETLYPETIIYRDDGVVVYFPNGFIDKDDKGELITKLINPMIDYSPGIFISITVDPNIPQLYASGNRDEKYSVRTIGKKDKGETGTFYFGSKKDGINWWTPTCLDNCSFTQSYRNTYPEVVKLSEK